MCGIAGFVGPRDPALLDRMGERVRHRGPDQEGVFVDEGCSLAHKRLSIIDLSDAGRQPLATADGRYVVAYNGEIYNFRALRKRYIAEGWTFRTQTDTECLLASAALHGLKDLDQFHGMFAFALWDVKEQRCYVARDRMGIKPLYLAETGGRIAFASEIGSLLPLQKTWPLDAVARSHYLAVGYVPGPRTMFSSIRALEPGKLFSIQGTTVKELHRFDHAPLIPAATSFADAADALRRLVDKAVAEQLVSDRPIGVFLSGGLDSTVVLSAMRQAQTNTAITTFTTRFRHETTDEKFNRDADIARRTASRYGCVHHEIELGPEDVIREAESIARHLGQPHANNSLPALDAAARLASQHVPVILSGDGGDESFGGYERYRKYAGVARWLASPSVRGIIRSMAQLHPRHASWDDLLSASEEAARMLTFHAPALQRRRTLFTSAVNDASLLDEWRATLASVSALDPVARFMALDRATWLRDDAFVRADRITMRHGVELRVPLTDDTLVAFAASLPRAFHVSSFGTKRLWRAAFADRCPPEVLQGHKRGWFPPTAKWMRAGLKDWAQTLVEEAISMHDWMDARAIRQAVADHQSGRTYGLQEIQTILGYQLWWRAHRSLLTDV